MSEPPPEDGEPQGSVRVTGPGPLFVVGLIGMVAGWSIRPLSLQVGFVEPTVPTISVVALFFVGAAIAGSAYATRRVVRRARASLPHHHAVNRLVLGKACALVGAVVTGGYLGFALAHLGIHDPAAEARMWRSLLAALGGLAVCVAALLLEHACRVPPADD